MDLNQPLQTLINLAQKAYDPKAAAPPTIHVEGERRYRVTANGLELLAAPRPKALAVNSLDAVVSYIKENRDEATLAKVLVHIENPRTVSVISSVDSNDAQRTTYVKAAPPVEGPDRFFGTYWEAEDFVIRLQTLFGDSPERKELLEIVGSLQSEAVSTVIDDGLSQQVKTKRGIKPAFETVKNPYHLVALRSFPEVSLPPAPYVVRLKGDGGVPTVALFESDGGRWVLEALEQIKAYLEPRLEGTSVALIC